MFGRTSILLLVVTSFLTAGDESAILREREDMLARAVRAKDKVVLSTLTNNGFHVSWTCGSGMRNFSAESLREDWIDDLIRLRIDTYEAVISKIRLVKGDQAFVDLDEFWTLHSPHGAPIERRFHTSDAWFKLQGVWKLVARTAARYPRDCLDGLN
jgi:hypothetical protein